MVTNHLLTGMILQVPIGSMILKKIFQIYTHDGSMGRFSIFTDPWMVDFYGKFVGKYTVRPMDPLGLRTTGPPQKN